MANEINFFLPKLAEKLTEKVMVRLDELKTFLDRWMGRGKSRLRIAYRNQQNVKYFFRSSACGGWCATTSAIPSSKF